MTVVDQLCNFPLHMLMQNQLSIMTFCSKLFTIDFNLHQSLGRISRHGQIDVAFLNFSRKLELWHFKQVICSGQSVPILSISTVNEMCVSVNDKPAPKNKRKKKSFFKQEGDSCLLFNPFSPADQTSYLCKQAVTSRLIWIYTDCHSGFDFRPTSLFAPVNMTESKEGWVYFNNSGLKGFIKNTIK